MRLSFADGSAEGFGRGGPLNVWWIGASRPAKLGLRQDFDFPQISRCEKLRPTPELHNKKNSTRATDKMASDEIVWQIINNQFCSFKLK
jgi:hypothetical protein